MFGELTITIVAAGDRDEIARSWLAEEATGRGVIASQLSPVPAVDAHSRLHVSTILQSHNNKTDSNADGNA